MQKNVKFQSNIRRRNSRIENQHLQTNTFQKPVFGIEECRNLHGFGLSTGIRQAFRSSFFTKYDMGMI
jgi:hypothetical protein